MPIKRLEVKTTQAGVELQVWTSAERGAKALRAIVLVEKGEKFSKATDLIELFIPKSNPVS